MHFNNEVHYKGLLIACLHLLSLIGVTCSVGTIYIYTIKIVLVMFYFCANNLLQS